MLHDWIIDELNKQKRKEQEERPTIQLPIPEDFPPRKQEKTQKEPDRGVVIIQIDDSEEK